MEAVEVEVEAAGVLLWVAAVALQEAAPEVPLQVVEVTAAEAVEAVRDAADGEGAAGPLSEQRGGFSAIGVAPPVPLE